MIQERSRILRPVGPGDSCRAPNIRLRPNGTPAETVTYDAGPGNVSGRSSGRPRIFTDGPQTLKLRAEAEARELRELQFRERYLTKYSGWRSIKHRVAEYVERAKDALDALNVWVDDL
jgi:hypothetical protein